MIYISHMENFDFHGKIFFSFVHVFQIKYNLKSPDVYCLSK